MALFQVGPVITTRPSPIVRTHPVTRTGRECSGAIVAPTSRARSAPTPVATARATAGASVIVIRAVQSWLHGAQRCAEHAGSPLDGGGHEGDVGYLLYFRFRACQGSPEVLRPSYLSSLCAACRRGGDVVDVLSFWLHEGPTGYRPSGQSRACCDHFRACPSPKRTGSLRPTGGIRSGEAVPAEASGSRVFPKCSPARARPAVRLDS